MCILPLSPYLRRVQSSSFTESCKKYPETNGGYKRMQRLCFFVSILAITVCAGGIAQADSILNFSGDVTLGPVIAGDPLNITGAMVTFTGSIDESLTPTACPAGVTATVCYAIPAGELSGTIAKPSKASIDFTTSTISTLALTINGDSVDDFLQVNFSD